MNRSVFALTLTTLLISSNVLSTPLVVDAQKQQALTITLYNQNLGLVRDVRSIPQTEENQRIIIEDISHQMMSETLRVEQAGDILEQNLNTNLITPDSLLQAYVGKSLQLARINQATGQESIYEIKLLSVQGNQAVIEKNNQVEIIPGNSSDWRFIFPAIPKGMQSKPSLEILSSGTSKSNQAVFTYLTQGLNWHMDYAINLNNEDSQLRLDGLATLINQTGVDYLDSQILLMAGQVNQQRPIHLKQQRAVMMAMSDATESGQPQEFEDYQLYKLPRKTTLLNNQTKQVSLISANNVNVTKTYQYNLPVYASLNRSEQVAKPDISLSIKNSKSDGLGFPLPAGTARVFKQGSNGIKQYIGSAQVRHTAAGQQVKLPIGKAFDLTIKQRQSDFKKNYDHHVVSHELTIRNSRGTPATLNLHADFSQPWSVEKSNQPFKKISASRAQWTVTVPGNQETTVTFQAKLFKN